jgi:uncharacterized membrane protein YjjB (DUF3815 family)
MNTVIQLASAFCGALGFALLYNHKGLNIFLSAIGGGLTWGVYLICESFTENLFFLNLTAAVFAAVYSEVMARIRKMPTTAFIMPSVIPLVPGGSLYYTLLHLINKDSASALISGTNTLLTAGGIAVGIVIVSVIMKSRPVKHMK